MFPKAPGIDAAVAAAERLAKALEQHTKALYFQGEANARLADAMERQNR